MNLSDYYASYEEDQRLNHSNASSIEYLTMLHFIRKYSNPDFHILDLGAATGVYSLPLAKEGYTVTAVEPVLRHVDILKNKKQGLTNLSIHQGNALDLSRFPDDTFDMVLCLGPLYHLPHEQHRLAIQEAKRVCKPGGFLFFACILHDAVILSETLNQPGFMLGPEYDPITFKVKEDPFIFSDIDNMKQLFQQEGISMITSFSADLLAETAFDKINSLTTEQFQEWMRFHLHICEKEYFLGCAPHWIYVGTK